MSRKLFCGEKNENFSNCIFFGFRADFFRHECRNCLRRVHKNTSVIIFFEVFSFFLDFEQKTFGRVVKTTFFAARRSFWENWFLERIVENVPILLQKKLQKSGVLARRNNSLYGGNSFCFIIDYDE